jgi:hypothetical protein
MRDIVWRVFHDLLPNPTMSGITAAAWTQFSAMAYLGDRKWDRRDAQEKARAIMRR